VLEIRHRELNKYQVIRGDNQHVVVQKARTKMAQWDEMYRKKVEREQAAAERARKERNIAENKRLAEERTHEAQQALSALEEILSHTLSVDDAVDWDALKTPAEFNKPVEPQIPREPQVTDERYSYTLGLLDQLVASRADAKKEKAKLYFQAEHQKWEEERDRLLSAYSEEVQKYEAVLADWEESNAAIDAQREDYLRGDDPQAILDYCDLVLSNSEYPDYFPQTYELDFNPDNRILVVDYQLPSLSSLPTLETVKYVQSKDEFTEKHSSQSNLNKLFDGLLYQIALRTIHELFEADRIDVLAAIVFNGYTRSVDPATGQEVNPCVLSVQANKDEFECINLALVDPKACFKKLKGIGSSKLHTLTPVAPILKIEREDARFTDAYQVVDGLQEEDNLAAMDWEDFEHLIRELFEKEFASAGGEVKVTRASRDGGVDAVIFDPDPIRGGKIIIQAKRYTNVVGVTFVRDLYGTVMNEGATKGILVTTSYFGADAYDFAKNKPLVLIDGNNLLHLLERHGHRAKIDLQEAKKLFADR
jgi:restriction system protein